MDEEQMAQAGTGAGASSDAKGADEPEGTSSPEASAGAGCGPDWILGNSRASGSKAGGPAGPLSGEFASSWRSIMSEMCGQGSLPDCCSGFFGRPAAARSGDAAANAAPDREASA